jgi:hypothetical protein
VSAGGERVAGYTVRLGDGSEIGPMDLEALKTWHLQGLIDGDSPVRPPRSRSWVPLGTLPEFKGAARSSRSGRKKGRKGAEDADEWVEPVRTEPISLDRLRVRATGLLLLVVALGIGFVAWRPHVLNPAFDGAPWLQIALAAAALGLLVLPGWDLGRRLVRVLLILGAFVLFPLTGILIAQGERGVALLALASAVLLILGLVAMLARVLGWAALALALVTVAAGAYGIVRFGPAPESEAAQEVRSWSSPERRFTDDSVGLILELPDGWVILKPGNPLVAAPEGTLVTIAQPRLDGYGYLTAEPAPRGVATPDQHLDRVMVRRRAEQPSLVEQGRGTAILGSKTGRRLDATWTDGEVPQRDLTVTAQDGWMSFALVAWMPEAHASRAGGLEPLAGALHVRGLLAPRLDAAVQAAVEAVPHLNAPAAQQLMAQSEARVLEPDQAFRRSVAALAQLLPALSRAETRELSGLTRATYAGVPWKERSRLASYIERVRAGDTTDPAVDRAMAELMKAAELRLSAEQRHRLQQYYERAITTPGELPPGEGRS